MLTEQDGIILDFLSKAQDRIREKPERLLFKPEYGHLVINWLRGLVELKPEGS